MKNCIFFITYLSIAQTYAQYLFMGNTQVQLNFAQSQTAVTYNNKPVLQNLGFWVCAVQGTDTLCIADAVLNSQSDWVNGPAHAQGNAWLSNLNQYWQVSKAEIEHHQTKYNQNGYIAPSSIANWPANITQPGFAKVLAPYVDANLDGSYNASQGDFPYVFGQKNVLMVLTDSMPKTNFKTKPLPVDITINAFVLDTLLNTMHLRITVCNRSSTALSNCIFSTVLNGKIGDEIDDAMETQVNNKSVCIYNGTNTDAIFGGAWPSIAFTYLNSPLSNSIYYKNENSAVYGIPANSMEFYNLAAGNWLSGKQLTYGGSGVDGTTPARWVYSGSTDTSAAKPTWNDDIDLGQRTVVASTTLQSLAAGQCKIIDAALQLVPNSPTAQQRSQAATDLIEQYKKQNFALWAPKINKSKQLKTYVCTSGQALNLDLQNAQIIDLQGKYISHNASWAPQSAGIYFVLTSSGLAGKIVVINP